MILKPAWQSSPLHVTEWHCASIKVKPWEGVAIEIFAKKTHKSSVFDVYKKRNTPTLALSVKVKWVQCTRINPTNRSWGNRQVRSWGTKKCLFFGWAPTGSKIYTSHAMRENWWHFHDGKLQQLLWEMRRQQDVDGLGGCERITEVL